MNRNIYSPPQRKNSISLEEEEETKLLPDSAFENSLCTSANHANQKKQSFFPGLPYSPSIYQWNNFVGAELQLICH